MRLVIGNAVHITPQTILAVFGILGLIVTSIVVGRSTAGKQNTKLQKELIATQGKKIEILEQQRDDDRILLKHNADAIAYLQGQLDLYKDLPLKEWAESMKTLSSVNKNTETKLASIALSNQQMLDLLKKSAVIAATDSDSPLLSPTQNVAEQHVEHQTVNIADTAA